MPAEQSQVAKTWILAIVCTPTLHLAIRRNRLKQHFQGSVCSPLDATLTCSA